MASEKDTYNAKWTDHVTNIFISLMVEEVKKGNCTSCTFNKAGWKTILAEFNSRARCQYKLSQLKNKMNKLRRLFDSFKKLLTQSGFGWDNVNKTVVVDDPSIWELHIKDNADRAKFKKDGFPRYSALFIVFGDTYATGEQALGNAEDLVKSEEGGDHGGHADDDPNDFGEHPTDEEVFTSGQHNLDRTTNTKRRRKSKACEISNTCKALQEMIKSRASQQSESAATSQVTLPPVDPFSISAVINVLLSIPELDADLYHKALERAMDSATWREAFIQTPIELRNGLLQRLR
ncbi:uncharacterized protein LOC115745419 [Rhodamnia argentea]|uniref:Uncharacterized protein LOC115745419 n=1 Tax=Rhodamnia argentea TaxID=178133 RepID=A0A8B8PPU7_9MYRT|nr:uncharacterized protein LOC115745419 [Rhodamnia argentea]